VVLVDYATLLPSSQEDIECSVRIQMLYWFLFCVNKCKWSCFPYVCTWLAL